MRCRASGRTKYYRLRAGTTARSARRGGSAAAARSSQRDHGPRRPRCRSARRAPRSLIPTARAWHVLTKLRRSTRHRNRQIGLRPHWPCLRPAGPPITCDRRHEQKTRSRVEPSCVAQSGSRRCVAPIGAAASCSPADPGLVPHASSGSRGRRPSSRPWLALDCAFHPADRGAVKVAGRMVSTAHGRTTQPRITR
jgi:hypothetical protein